MRTIPALLCAALASSMMYDSSTKAATSVYYQFTGTGTVSNAAGAVTDSSGNNLNGTAITINNGNPAVTGALPVYSTDSAGPTITNGLGGAVINSSNTSSVKFNNTGVESQDRYDLSSGGQIRVAVTTANASKLQPTNFTAEAFIKTESNIAYSTIFGMSGGNGTISWQLDADPRNAANNATHSASTEAAHLRLRYRADHQLATSDPNYAASVQPVSPFNTGNNDSGMSFVPGQTGIFSDDQWHHVALTYDESLNQFRFYLDYQHVATGTLNQWGSQNLVYTQGGNSYLIIGGGGGGRGFDGWIDEFRFSDGILGVNQFLYAVPEPGRAMLLVLGIGLFAFTRKRARIFASA